MQARRLKTAVAIAAVAALAVGAAGCAKSERDGDSGEAKTGGTFIFAGAGDPKNFDPIFNDDGESFRPVRQMFDTLVSHKPGTADLQGGLAELGARPRGQGLDVQAPSGCEVPRRHPVQRRRGLLQLRPLVQHEGRCRPVPNDLLHGHLRRVRQERGRGRRRVDLQQVRGQGRRNRRPDPEQVQGRVPGAFALTSLSIASPEALKKYDANTVTQNGDSFSYSAFANEHPVGTGPFTFGGWDKAKNEITLNRNPDYFGEKAKVDKMIIKVIKDESTCKQELRAGTVQGIDFPAPADGKALEAEGFQVINRPAFNILYLGINQKNPKLKDLRVRQALAYALNRQQLVQTKGPIGAKVADEFMPDTVLGYAPDVQKYEYNPDKAKQLLKEAGAEGLTLNFYYPPDVTRPYMPNPQEIFTVLANDLQAVGIKVNGVPRPWNGGFKDDVQQFGKHDLHILGWTGDYNDPGNFVGTFFGRGKAEFGDQSMNEMFDAITKADGTVDEAGKKAAWEQVNRDIAAKWLPAVPVWHAPPAIVVTKDVKGLAASPLTDERFNTVSISK